MNPGGHAAGIDAQRIVYPGGVRDTKPDGGECRPLRFAKTWNLRSKVPGRYFSFSLI